MKFPSSEHLGICHGPDGSLYSLSFYGDNEGAAVVTGPVPKASHRIVAVPEMHREHAASADEARAKLDAWRRARGWIQGPETKTPQAREGFARR